MLPDVLALDLDGTTLGPDGRVSAATRAAVNRVRAAGVRVVVATGRSYTESRRPVEELGHEDLGVFVGGSLVVDCASGATAHRTHLPPEVARDICRVMLDHGTRPVALQDRDATGADYILQGDAPLDPARREWFETMGVIFHEVPDLAGHDHADTLRVSVLAPVADNVAAQRRIDAALAGRLHTHRLDVRVPGQDLLEVFDASATKWTGLLRAVGEGRTVTAVGDDLNDLHMLRGAATAVAMGNAHPDVKAAADLVIGDHAEDGLAAYLDDLLAAG